MSLIFPERFSVKMTESSILRTWIYYVLSAALKSCYANIAISYANDALYGDQARVLAITNRLCFMYKQRLNTDINNRKRECPCLNIYCTIRQETGKERKKERRRKTFLGLPATFCKTEN
jgi:hypothetical protein